MIFSGTRYKVHVVICLLVLQGRLHPFLQKNKLVSSARLWNVKFYTKGRWSTAEHQAVFALSCRELKQVYR